MNEKSGGMVSGGDIDTSFVLSTAYLSFGKRIEQGNYGEIYEGQYKGIGEVAIKVVPLGDVDDILQKYLEREMLAIMRVSHPNIVKTYGFCFEDGSLQIVMEYLVQGDLRQRLSYCSRTRTPISWLTRIEYTVDIARAMQYLHSSNLLHRDIKSANLLIGDDGQIKLCDFGFTREMPMSASEIESLSAVGTDLWAAPEVLMEKPYGTPADVFSFAMVMTELITFTLPPTRYKPNFHFDAVKFEKRLPGGTPMGYWTLLCLCADNKPSERPTFDVILDCLEMLRETSFIETKKAKKSHKKRMKQLETALSVESAMEDSEHKAQKQKKHKSAGDAPNMQAVLKLTEGALLTPPGTARRGEEGKKTKRKKGKKTKKGKKEKRKDKFTTSSEEKDGPEETANTSAETLSSKEEKLNKEKKDKRRKRANSTNNHTKEISVDDKTRTLPAGLFRSQSSMTGSKLQSFKERMEEKLERSNSADGSEIKEIIQKSASVLLEKRATEIRERNVEARPRTASNGGDKAPMVKKDKKRSENLPDEGEEVAGNVKIEVTEEDDGFQSVRQLSDSGFISFKARMENKLAQSRTDVRCFLPRTTNSVVKDGISESGVHTVKTKGEKRERRESHSFIMHDRAVVYMTKNISSWFKKKTMSIECSWLNSLRYAPGMQIHIRVCATCSHPSPKKHLNGRVYISTTQKSSSHNTLATAPKEEKPKLPLNASRKHRRAHSANTLNVDTLDNTTDDTTNPTPTPTEEETKAGEQAVFFSEVFANGTSYKGEVIYTVPSMEEMGGSTCSRRLHRLCFEFHLSTRQGLIKDPLKGHLPLFIKSKLPDK